MGEHELQSALRREADDKILGLWEAAESEVAARREALASELGILRQNTEEEARAEALAVRRGKAAGMQQELRRCRLMAWTALETRLLSLAGEVLLELADTCREQLWRGTVAELPAAEWHTLTVHPKDAQRARLAFPRARVRINPALLGGVIAATEDERLVIDNSLSGRLSRCWAELWPELTAALEKEVARDGTAGPATAG